MTRYSQSLLSKLAVKKMAYGMSGDSSAQIIQVQGQTVIIAEEDSASSAPIEFSIGEMGWETGTTPIYMISVGGDMGGLVAVSDKPITKQLLPEIVQKAIDLGFSNLDPDSFITSGDY